MSKNDFFDFWHACLPEDYSRWTTINSVNVVDGVRATILYFHTRRFFLEDLCENVWLNEATKSD